MRLQRAGGMVAGILLAAIVAAQPASATPLTLRQAAAAAGIYVGVATNPAELATGVDAIVAREFNSVTPENQMKWSELAPAPGVYEFGPADALVAFAEANAMRVRGHTLVWGRPNGPPAWLDTELAAAPDPAAHLHDLMLDHIDTVAGRYAGRIETWDVVNEPLAFVTGDLDPTNPYFQLLGEHYIAEAFQAARAADPNAKLFLNETGSERIAAKFTGLVELVDRLLSDGVPVDGVGLQGHFLTRPNRAGLDAQLRTFAEMGLLVEITELDLPLVIFSRDADPLASQAQAYADVFAACLAVSACRGITTWGVTDANSWLDNFELLQFFAPNQPLLFDADGLPKPAYDAVLATLVAAPEPATLSQLLLAVGVLALHAGGRRGPKSAVGLDAAPAPVDSLVELTSAPVEKPMTASPQPSPEPRSEWRKTACILCSLNCGIEVQLDGRRLARVRGDKAHPGSAGYTCEKPARLDHYQNGRHRLTTPLRRRAGGGFEAIDWDTAIREVAAAFGRIRDVHGGDKILYYGGGGQGNHLPGAYARATRSALGSVYAANALSQEKTGEFWVDGQLFGRPSCHTAPDFEHAEVAVFIGKNPWQSHGFPRARAVLREIAKDPNRTLIVIDPRRTETADLADFHLQVRPGTDAFALTALLAVLIEEDLVDHAFLRDHANGADEVFAALRETPIAGYCERAGIEESMVREVARCIGRAASVSILEDLGIQQTRHSTLNSYLEKLAYLLTGNFGKRGTPNLHTQIGKLAGGGRGDRRTPVGGHRVIAGLVPCNVIPDEILTDDPKRFRALLVESGNPAHSLADSQRMRQALEALELVVVIDVALTETARMADYVLPASSQLEKWEATFFNLEFPRNVFHLRAPLLDPLPGTLPEAEIHARLVRALGALTDEDVAPLLEAATQSRAAFAGAFFQALAAKPQLAGLAPVLLYETLGKTLPDGAAAAAVIWGLAHNCARAYPESLRRAGFDGDGIAQGEALFDAILARRSGVVFSIDDYDETWKRIDTPDGRLRLAVPELLAELRTLRDEDPAQRDFAFPFVLAAGERRTSTANTIFRDPAWRKKDADGALRICPEDAAALGIVDGGRARVTTKRGSVVAVVEITDTLRSGHVTLPNGLGLAYPDENGNETVRGVAPNELTASEDRDWLAGTPWHKHVAARVEAIGG